MSNPHTNTQAQQNASLPFSHSQEQGMLHLGDDITDG